MTGNALKKALNDVDPKSPKGQEIANIQWITTGGAQIANNTPDVMKNVTVLEHEGDKVLTYGIDPLDDHPLHATATSVYGEKDHGS